MVDRLSAACSAIETSLAPKFEDLLAEARSELLTVWSAVQRMRTWLRSPTSVTVYAQVSSKVDSTWSAADISRSIQIMRSRPDPDHVAHLLRVMRVAAGERIVHVYWYIDIQILIRGPCARSSRVRPQRRCRRYSLSCWLDVPHLIRSGNIFSAPF
jgi:hypothetical protein